MTASRFTGDDLVCLSAAILAELDAVSGRAPSMAEDFNRVMRSVPAVVGRRPIELLESELEELAEMVTDAIAGYVPNRPVREGDRCPAPGCHFPVVSCDCGEAPSPHLICLGCGQDADQSDPDASGPCDCRPEDQANPDDEGSYVP